MVPMNLYEPGKPVDVLHTGAWSAKAIEELKKALRSAAGRFDRSGEVCACAAKDEIALSPDASYVHICTNNTIEGTQWHDAGNGRRAAGGGHVLGYRVAANGRAPVRADFRGRAEKSWAFRSHGGDCPQRSGRP